MPWMGSSIQFLPFLIPLSHVLETLSMFLLGFCYAGIATSNCTSGSTEKSIPSTKGGLAYDDVVSALPNEELVLSIRHPSAAHIYHSHHHGQQTSLSPTFPPSFIALYHLPSHLSTTSLTPRPHHLPHPPPNTTPNIPPNIPLNQP